MGCFFHLGTIESVSTVRIRTYMLMPQEFGLPFFFVARTFYFPPYVWPMDDKADPLNGWPIREVARVQTMAKEDLYGKLYLYLQDVFQKFLDRLARVGIDFELLNMDAIELPANLQKNKYARVEVCNHKAVRFSIKVTNLMIGLRCRISLMLGTLGLRRQCVSCPLCFSLQMKTPVPALLHRI